MAKTGPNPRFFGSSDKFLFGTVKVIEFEDEESFIAVTVGRAGHDLDLIVDALHAARVDGLLEPGKDPLAPGAEGFD